MRNNKRALIVLFCIVVTSTSAWATERYSRTTVDEELVVGDTITGLMWQGCTAGQSGSTCTGEATNYTWSQAQIFCSELSWGGYADWRLPNVKELFSITDLKREKPSIDVNTFPNNTTGYYWTDTPIKGMDQAAWSVSFFYGDLRPKQKTAEANTRCVRTN